MDSSTPTPINGIALLCALVLVAGTGCGMFSDDAGLAEMSLRAQRGGVTVLRGDSSTRVEGSFGIQPGDEIVTSAGAGRAELRLEGDRRIELGSGSRIEVTGTDSVTGLGGLLLAQSGGGERLAVRFGEALAESPDSLFRVDLGRGNIRIVMQVE